MERFYDMEAVAPGVSRATDRLTQRQVILKSGNAESLRRELMLLTRFRHPGLRRVIDYGEGQVVFEHLVGAPLQRDLFPQHDVVDLLGQVLRALLCLHGSGFVHGDIKPENIIVGPDKATLIDLGLSVPMSSAPQGGTAKTMPPEYLKGGSASASGDLYSLGKTFMDVMPEGTSDPIRTHLRRCIEEVPSQRPSSVAGLLAALDLRVHTRDRLGVLPRLSDHELVNDAATLLAEGRGHRMLVSAQKGYGATRLCDDVFAECAHQGIPTVRLDFTRNLTQPSPLVGLAQALGTSSNASTAAALVRQGRRLICDLGSQPGPDELEFLRSLLRHADSLGTSALLVVGAVDALEEQGLNTRSLKGWDGSLTETAASHWSLRARSPQLKKLHKITQGAPGKTMRALEVWSNYPERRVADLFDVTLDVPTPNLDPRAIRKQVDDALSVGACATAEHLVGHLDDDDTSYRLRAKIASLRGNDEMVLAHLHTLEDNTLEDQVLRVRSLQRLGRHAEAIDIASNTDSSKVVPAWAKSLRDTGKLFECGQLVSSALKSASGSEAIELLSIASDLSLQSGDIAKAKRYAKKALSDSKRLKRRASIASAEARFAGVLGMQGKWKEAREHYAAALAEVREHSELGSLSTYMMNLAVADHALGHYGDAIELYERAATLADRFSRHNSAFACRINLAGLFCSIGATHEARSMLETIEPASDSDRQPLYEGQSVLLQSEVAFGHEGAEIAARAIALFEAAGATRQVCEASLIRAHRLAEVGQLEASIESLPKQADADAFGLGSRWLLVSTLCCSDRVRQRSLAVSAVKASSQTGDSLLRMQCLALAVDLLKESDPNAANELYRTAEALRHETQASVPKDMQSRLSLPSIENPVRRISAAAETPMTRLSEDARRLLSLSRRILLERDEARVLSYALDEAIIASAAERAFLLRKKSKGTPQVVSARNFDRETIRNSRFRFSKSVAHRVLSTGETVLTASAMTDPSLSGARSIHDLGVRSILCVPIATAEGLIGALYLDHRFSDSAFSNNTVELVQGIADLIGLSLENNRLHQESERRASDLERAHADLRADAARQAVELARLSSERRNRHTEDDDEDGIVGQSPAIRAARDTIRRVAPSDLSVVIQGESGTGKELFAQLIHRRSLRSEAPFVAINCASLSPTLLESELFGHVRGAFTGAVRDHIGIFRSAATGTVFLDEIGEMPSDMQSRLLRVLQERCVRPVGGTQDIPVDVRVIAATNRDLKAMTKEKRFREDLYFRLAGAVIELPPLRSRKEDIPRLMSTLLERIAGEPGMSKKKVSADAMRLVLSYKWPGNIRELEQSLRRAVLISGEDIRAQDLMLRPQATATRNDAIHAFDRTLILEALHAAGGNKSKAARELGVSRVTLYRWLNRYDIS